MNYTPMERVQCILSNVNLEQELWVKPVSMACYLINHSPSIALEMNIPNEVWYESPSYYSHLKIWGYDAYAHVPGHQKNKLDL